MVALRPPGAVRVPQPKWLSARQVKTALQQLKLGVVKAQRLLPEIVDWLDAVRLDDEWPKRFRIEAAKLLREIAELELKQEQNITHQFVLRSPAVMSSAEAWEEKYGGPDIVDVTPLPPPPEPYVPPEVPPIPTAEQSHPVYGSGSPGYSQGHTLRPNPYGDMTDRLERPHLAHRDATMPGTTNPGLDASNLDAAAPRPPREKTAAELAREQREREISPSYRPPGWEGAIPVEQPLVPGSFEQMVALEGHDRFRGRMATLEKGHEVPGQNLSLVGRRRNG